MKGRCLTRQAPRPARTNQALAEPERPKANHLALGERPRSVGKKAYQSLKGDRF